jgi:signal transduction histidine kinase
LLTVAANAALPMIGLAMLLDGPNIGRAISNQFFIVIVAVIGHNVRLRKEKRVHEERVEVLEADTAVADERLRIARELHDVVAHAMSVVAVQAGVAAHVIDTQPDEAKRMLENVRITSHDALDEMRRLLGVLRGGDAELAPQPGLSDVDALAESMRESGVPVDVRVTGDATGVPAGVDLTAYRIVQEALTNVLKHAGPASVQVSIDYSPVLVVVEISDDGRGGLAGEGGHGLLGMRERVAVFGGDLVTGPGPGGGFRVRATLPYGR